VSSIYLSLYKLIDKSANEIALNKDDFNWSYSSNNLLKVEEYWTSPHSYSNTSGLVYFLPYSSTVAAGPVTVTGTLKCDSRQKLQFPIEILRAQSVALKYSNPYISETTLPMGGLSLTYDPNNTYRNDYNIGVDSITYTNGSTYYMTNGEYFQLNLTSSDPAKLRVNSGTQISAKSTGTVNLTVKPQDDLTRTLAVIPVTITQ
jgi:hypothetical protein